MSAGFSSNPPSTRTRLAARLRQIRIDAGLTSTQLAEVIGISQGKVSKIETGAQSVRVDHVDVWARACSVPEQLRTRLLEMAESALTEASTWRREHRAGLSAKQVRLANLERRTTRLRTFEPGVVPGLLQTPDYAAAAIAHGDLSRQRDVAAAAAARIDRQRILEAATPDVEILLFETALSWRPDGPEGMMAAQAERIAGLAVSSQARIGVVPAGAAGVPPPANGFAIYDLDEDDPLVVAETFAAEVYHDDLRDVAAYVEIFEALSKAALFGAEVRRLLPAK